MERDRVKEERARVTIRCFLVGMEVEEVVEIETSDEVILRALYDEDE